MRKVKYHLKSRNSSKFSNITYLNQYVDEISYKLRFMLCFNYLCDFQFKNAFRVLRLNLTNEEYNLLRAEAKSKFNPTTVIKKPKIGRNALCPCGSGKKYKYCCGKWK